MNTHASIGITGKELLVLASLEEVKQDNSYCSLDERCGGGFLVTIEYSKTTKGASGALSTRYESRYSYNGEKGLMKLGS